jgi:HlyD family secretion protein
VRRRILVAAIASAVVVAGGGVASAQAQGSSGSYRTATVTVGDVDRTLMLSGTIAASSRQDLSFGVAGTVTKVGVQVGDVVRSGSVLATLDDTNLQTAVTKAEATLAKAKAQLESDENSQSATVATGSSSGASSSGGSSSGGSSSGSGSSSKPSSGASSSVSPKLAAALASLKKQQAAVTTAQTAATAAIAAAKAALAAQVDACKVVEPTDAPTDPAPTTDGATSGGLSEECTTALDAVQAAQDVVADKQNTLQTALEALAKTLTGAVAEIQKPPASGSGSASSSSNAPSTSGSSSSSSTGSSSGSASGGSASGGGGGGGAGGGGPVSAATLAQDQASIDTAQAAVTEAKRSRDAAELTAPFSGKILSVSAAKGDSVAASDVVVVIAGDGDTTVTTTVTAAQVAEVKKGQKAAVTPAGATKAVSGTVTSIGLLPDSSSGTATYPVTLNLASSVAAPEGSTASIALVIGTAKNALTVPSSAVSTLGRTTVSVLTDGNVVRTPVTVGTVGSTRTSITQGLTKGQQVVIADLSAALPAGDSTTTQLPGTRGGGGGFGGGGAGGGTRRTQQAG